MVEFWNNEASQYFIKPLFQYSIIPEYYLTAKPVDG